MRNRELAINLFASILSVTVSFAISFFISPYLVAKIGAEAYGFSSLATNFISYASLITIALNSMASRYISVEIHKGNLEKANIYFNSNIIANAIISVLFIIVSVPLIINLEKMINVSPEIEIDVKMLFALFFLSFILSIVTNAWGCSYFVKNKLYFSNIRLIETSIFRCAGLFFLFFFFSPKIMFFGIVTVISSLYVILFNFYYFYKLVPELKFNSNRFDFKAVKELFSSGIWNSANQLGTILNQGLDLLICNIFINGPAMGVLAISKTIPSMIQTILSTIVTIFTPATTIQYAKNSKEGMIEVLNKSIKTMGLIANLPVGLFVAFGYSFFKLWQPTQDAKLLYILSVLSILATMFATSTAGVYNIFIAYNKLKLVSIVHIISGLLTTLLVLFFLQITDWGIYTIAGVSSTISIFKVFGFVFPYAARCINEKWYYFYYPSLRSFFSILITILIGYAIQLFVSIDSWALLFLFVGLAGSLVFVFNIYIILNRTDRDRVLSAIITKIRKIGKI